MATVDITREHSLGKEKAKEQERKERERLDHWQRLRVEYPAIERTA